MKSKLSLFAGIAMAVALISSCQNEPSSRGTDITGIWSFNTLNGEYAELWVNENSLLTLRNPSPRPSVFDYVQKGDTIKLYIQGDAGKRNPPLDQFYILSRKDDKVKLLQDGNENELTLIDGKAPEFKSTEEFKEKVLNDFKSRAPQN